MDNNLIKYISNYLKLGKLLNMPEILPGGLTNKNYMIKTQKGAYVIKILNKSNLDKLKLIEFSENISSLACESGIHSFPALKYNNKYVQCYNGEYFLIYEYFNGRVILSKEIDEHKCRILASELAKIHKLDSNKIEIIESETDNIYNKRIDFSFYKEKLNAMEKEWTKDFIDNYLKIMKIYDKVYNCYQMLSNQKSLTHKDLNRKNILWNENEFVIIDWENARYSNPSLDFFNTAWFLTDDVEENKYMAFAEEYFKNYRFDDYIDIAVYAALIDEILWLEFSLKRALGNISSNIEEIEIGKTQIKPTIKEIINYYEKTELMIKICNNAISKQLTN